MTRSGSLALTTRVFAVGLALLAFGAAGVRAQNPPRKNPSGAYVQAGTPLSTVTVGKYIVWTVSVTNPSPVADGVFAFVDAPQGNWLPSAGGQPECETGGGPGGGGEVPGAQRNLYYANPDGDAQCDPAVEAFDAFGDPITVTVDCDDATQILKVRDINVPAGSSATLRFVTQVSPGAAGQVCNWGHIYAPEIGDTPPNQRSDTYPYTGGFTAGCSCLNVAPPSGYDVTATKVAAITAPGGRLIPGQRDATVQYTITITNTGGTDITDGQILDTVGGPTVAEGKGLEWVSVDDAGAATCTINPANTRLSCTGINIPATDPDTTYTLKATARVTCGAATDTDNGEVCNQAQLTVTGAPRGFPTDDPDTVTPDDATCTPVVWSNLTTSQKFVDGFTDTNGNGQLDVGENVNFRIRARNAGRLTASGVVVTDDVGATGCLDGAAITAADGGAVAGGVITWNVGDLAPLGGAADVHFSAPLTANQLCCNQGSVQSTEREGCGLGAIRTDDDATSEDPARFPADPTCASPGPQPNLTVHKTVQNVDDRDGDGQYDVGERVRWTVTVFNAGPGTATSAAFNDDLYPCMRSFAGGSGVTVTTTDGTDAGDPSCSVPYAPPTNPGHVCVSDLGGANGIVPGETVTIEFEAAIAGLNGCCNIGDVTHAERSGGVSTDDPGTPGLVDDPTCLAPPPCVPTGRLEKKIDQILDSDLDGRAEVGEGIRYVMTFANVGCGTLSSVHITDASSACLGLQSGSVVVTPSTGVTDNSTGGGLDITIAGPLAPTDSVQITFTATALAEGANCCNQASWTAAEIPAGGLSDSDVTDLTPERPTCSDWLAQDGGTGGSPDLQISKTLTQTGCQDPGATVNYTITVVNAGLGDATSFDVSDVLPAGLTNINVDAPGTYDAASNTVSYAGGRLGSRESAVVKFSAQLPCTGSGTITNTASVSFVDGTGATVTRQASVDVTYGLPVLSVTKTATPNAGADGVLGPGETVSYVITVSNTGACDAKDVVVTDVLESFWNIGGATIGQGGTISPADTVRWDSTTTPSLALVSNGTPVTLNLTVPVAAGFTTRQDDTNSATATATGHDLAACGGTAPTTSGTSNSITINGTGGATQDLLVESAPGPALSNVLTGNQLATDVFENETPNTTACGDTDLNRAQDVVQTDVGGSLATGVTVTAAQATGVLVFFEVSERCDAEEGAPADQPIIVRKAAGGNFVVKLAP